MKMHPRQKTTANRTAQFIQVLPQSERLNEDVGTNPPRLIATFAAPAVGLGGGDVIMLFFFSFLRWEMRD
jgi:hypothetical protein